MVAPFGMAPKTPVMIVDRKIYCLSGRWKFLTNIKSSGAYQ